MIISIFEWKSVDILSIVLNRNQHRKFKWSAHVVTLFHSNSWSTTLLLADVFGTLVMKLKKNKLYIELFISVTKAYIILIMPLRLQISPKKLVSFFVSFIQLVSLIMQNIW